MKKRRVVKNKMFFCFVVAGIWIQDVALGRACGWIGEWF